MLLRIERRQAAPPAPVATEAQLVEIVSPRTNAASYAALEHFFAALARLGAVSLEIAGDSQARRFYVRLATNGLRERLAGPLGAAYPQARLRSMPADPARCLADEQVASCTLELQEPEYLPLHIPRDVEIAADRAPQADPLLGVLVAAGSLPPGWRAVVQLVLQPAPAIWARRHLRRTVEHALEPERAEAAGRRPGWGGAVLGLAFLAAVVVLPRLWALYLAHGWLVALLGVPVVVGLGWLYALWLRLSGHPLYDLELVKDKLGRPAARAELRLAVFAPATAPAAEVQSALDQLVAAYRAYDLERGNRLTARPLRLPDSAPDLLCTPTPLRPVRRLATLSTRELAGLWHLVHAGDDVALVERTTARRFLPLPETVAEGSRLGLAEDGLGRQVPVHLAPALLRRHALLVAKTRKGKSALLRRLFLQLVGLPDRPEAPAPAVVLVDPHSDLARAALGLVPPECHARVVHLDVGQAARPFGLNLLDTGLGWNRDQLVENALRVFKHEFDHFWGPRMELVFRMALVLLVDANQRLVAADPTGGRARQYTILEVPRVLEDELLRARLLKDLPDPQMQALWRTFFKPLDPRFRLEVINPVQTKVYKFAASQTAQAIVGQSRSTIDPLGWVRHGAVVIVDAAKERVGADIAALIGGTIVNQVALAVGQQAVLPPRRRRHVAVLVDEFHLMPAGDYEAFLAELAKYGGSLVLATQSLGVIDALEPERGLRHAVFSNVDHLFTFNCSAEDARTLAPELGAPIEPADLIELGDYQCYPRLSRHGERLPAFHLRLDPPPEGDPSVAEVLAACSATQYGRDAAAVAADRAALLAGLEEPAASEGQGHATADPENGRLPPASAGDVAGPPPAKTRPARSDGRPRNTANAVHPDQQRLALEREQRERGAGSDGPETGGGNDAA